MCITMSRNSPPQRLPSRQPVCLRGGWQVLAGPYLGDEGIEHPPLALSKTPISETASAKSGAPKAENTPPDPDLAKIVQAWPELPEGIRSAVLAIVRNAVGR